VLHVYPVVEVCGDETRIKTMYLFCQSTGRGQRLLEVDGGKAGWSGLVIASFCLAIWALPKYWARASSPYSLGCPCESGPVISSAFARLLRRLQERVDVGFRHCRV